MADDNTQGQGQPKPASASPPPPPPTQQAKPLADPKATAKPPKQCFSDDYQGEQRGGKKNGK